MSAGDGNPTTLPAYVPACPMACLPTCLQVNLTEKDYARKKNKWLAKIHAW